MPSQVPGWFFAELVALWAKYPTAPPMGPEVAPVWWRDLCEYSEAAVRAAFRRAPRDAAQARYMPSCEDIRRIAEAEDKARRAYPLRSPEPRRLAAACDLAEDNPFRLLAERWEREAPVDASCCADVGAQRLRELNALLSGTVLGEIAAWQAKQHG
jgi:hypothetical protein